MEGEVSFIVLMIQRVAALPRRTPLLQNGDGTYFSIEAMFLHRKKTIGNENGSWGGALQTTRSRKVVLALGYSNTNSKHANYCELRGA